MQSRLRSTSLRGTHATSHWQLGMEARSGAGVPAGISVVSAAHRGDALFPVTPHWKTRVRWHGSTSLASLISSRRFVVASVLVPCLFAANENG